jgi:hypothetical protein
LNNAWRNRLPRAEEAFFPHLPAKCGNLAPICAAAPMHRSPASEPGRRCTLARLSTGNPGLPPGEQSLFAAEREASAHFWFGADIHIAVDPVRMAFDEAGHGRHIKWFRTGWYPMNEADVRWLA